jgi:hypothetical protein
LSSLFFVIASLRGSTVPNAPRSGGVARFSRGAFAFAAMNRPFRSRSIEVRRARVPRHETNTEAEPRARVREPLRFRLRSVSSSAFFYRVIRARFARRDE